MTVPSDRPGPDAHLLALLAAAPRESVPGLLLALASRLLEPEPAPLEAPDPAPPREPDGDRLIDAEAVALRLGLDIASVARRRFPFAVKIGHRTRRYSELGLEEWIRKNGRA
jgi:predicted DNA-binding transcriptional regulator AlpA